MKKYFLLSTNFKLLRLIKGDSENELRNFLKVLNFVRGGYCDWSPRASKKPSYATARITVIGCLDVAVGGDRNYK
jgi:hypothetical protein